MRLQCIQLHIITSKLVFLFFALSPARRSILLQCLQSILLHRKKNLNKNENKHIIQMKIMVIITIIVVSISYTTILSILCHQPNNAVSKAITMKTIKISCAQSERSSAENSFEPFFKSLAMCYYM